MNQLIIFRWILLGFWLELSKSLYILDVLQRSILSTYSKCTGRISSSMLFFLCNPKESWWDKIIRMRLVHDQSNCSELKESCKLICIIELLLFWTKPNHKHVKQIICLFRIEVFASRMTNNQSVKWKQFAQTIKLQIPPDNIS